MYQITNGETPGIFNDLWRHLVVCSRVPQLTLRVCVYLCVCICMCVYLCVCICVCVFVYVCAGFSCIHVLRRHGRAACPSSSSTA